MLKYDKSLKSYTGSDKQHVKVCQIFEVLHLISASIVQTNNRYPFHGHLFLVKEKIQENTL